MLYIEHAKDINYIKASLRKFVNLIDVPKSAKILVKPNLVLLEGYPYTTDPQIMYELLELLQHAGAKQIVVGDGPCPDQGVVFGKTFPDKDAEVEAIRTFHREIRSTDSFEKELRYYKAYEKNIVRYMNYFFQQINLNNILPAGIKYIDLFSLEGNIPLKTAELTNYRKIKHLDLPYFDVNINLPVLKLHTTVGFTAAIKNFYGILTPFCKISLHKYKMVGVVLEYLHNYLKDMKIFSFLDCRKVPDAQQPIWGTLKAFNTDTVIFRKWIVLKLTRRL